ncbi:MAG: sensor domain-containing diguanylate cyclase [Myxococcota bacterium]|nr:sensor domain-containing diguanylate cyclase [Myxococcota bacterium]
MARNRTSVALACACGLALLCAADLAAAQSSPALRLGDDDRYDVARIVRIYRAEPGDSITEYESLRRRGRFDHAAADPARALHEGGAVWIVLDVTQTLETSGPTDWVLWDRGAAQFLDARLQIEGRPPEVQRSGFFVAPQNRPLQAFGYAFPFRLSTGERAELVLHGYLPPREATELLVLRAPQFRYLNLVLSLLVFGVIGAMLALAGYNALVYSAFRDPAYGLYAAYAASSAFLWATTHSVVTLFTDTGHFDLRLNGLAVTITVLIALRFTHEFLELGQTMPRLSRVYRVLYVLAAAAAIGAIALPPTDSKMFSMVVAIPIMGVLVFTPMYALAKGIRRARFMVLGWAPAMFVPFLIALRGLGVAELRWLSKDLVIAIHGYAVLTMALAVADRIREIDVGRDRAQREAVAQLQLRLEEREKLLAAIDATRTAQEDAQRERVRGATDELTGLGNRRAFESERPRVAAQWSSELAINSLVCVVDVDGLKKLNDTTGHAEGDRMLARFGAQLRASLRDTDRVYRIGGDEFALFARAPDAPAKQAIESRIRRAIAGVKVEFPDIDASVGTALLSEVEGDVLAAYSLADERMYTEKRARQATAVTEGADSSEPHDPG